MALRVGEALANGHALPPVDEAAGSAEAAHAAAAGPGGWLSWAFPPAAQLPGPTPQFVPQLAHHGAGPSAPAGGALYYGNGAQQPMMPYANGGARLPGLAWGPGAHAPPAGGNAPEGGASTPGEPVRRSSREPKSRIIMARRLTHLHVHPLTVQQLWVDHSGNVSDTRQVSVSNMHVPAVTRAPAFGALSDAPYDASTSSSSALVAVICCLFVLSPTRVGCAGAQINGIPCLKANNYTLEEGEQSVFSRELKSALISESKPSCRALE